MEKILNLRCLDCGTVYAYNEVEYTCPACRDKGQRGTLDVIYDFDRIRKQVTKQDFTFNTNYTLWRFLPFLPVGDIRTIQPLKTGCTPLYNSRRLAEVLRVRNAYVKDDGRNPTGSSKDRASTIGICKALEKGFRQVACASTGNMASSVAAFAASAGLPASILVPSATSAPKLSQIVIYGSDVLVLDGTYQQATDILQQKCNEHDVYNLSSINPYLLEGQKSIAYEICEQMGFDTPDRVFVPVGDGQTLCGIYKGFQEFIELGFVDAMPQLIGIQSEQVSPIVDLFETGVMPAPTPARTIADSIRVSAPTHGSRAVDAVRRSNGDMVRVSDSEILESMKTMAATTGVFCEPAAAAALAGAMRMQREGRLDGNERIVILSTGVGLKDIQSAMAAGQPATTVTPGDPIIDSIFTRSK